METAMSTLPAHDHMSNYTPSLDAKGSTGSAAKVGKSTKRTGHCYGAPYPENSTPGFNSLITTHAVYYRLYTKLGAFESSHTL